MPLSTGDRLRPYQILSPIGKGGMGEAWRARDPRLCCIHHMPLSAGAKIGHYEVPSLLGKGEVYRACDLNLKRDVAHKVLPGGVARDPDRLARFKREAEILASLNSSGTAAIYGMAGNALMMELVDGVHAALSGARGSSPCVREADCRCGRVQVSP